MSRIKTVLITGANRGIGFEIGNQLGELGFNVILTAKNFEKSKQAVKKLQRKGFNVIFEILNVSDPDSISDAYNKISQKINHLDVLVNNAGILLDPERSILEMSPDEDLESIKVNGLGALWVTQKFLPLLKRGSRIIMISSGAGKFNDNASTWAPHYRISKTLLNAITKQFHLTFKNRGITINAVCPGWVRTQMGGPAAERSVRKGAETPVWLATEAPTSIDGQFLRDKKIIDW